MQTVYELRISDKPASLSKADKLIWNSKKVESHASVFFSCDGLILKSCTRYYWQVRVWDNNQKFYK